MTIITCDGCNYKLVDKTLDKCVCFHLQRGLHLSATVHTSQSNLENCTSLFWRIHQQYEQIHCYHFDRYILQYEQIHYYCSYKYILQYEQKHRHYVDKYILQFSVWTIHIDFFLLLQFADRFALSATVSHFSKQFHKAPSSWAKSQSHLGPNLSLKVWKYAKCRARDSEFVKSFLIDSKNLRGNLLEKYFFEYIFWHFLYGCVMIGSQFFCQISKLC